MNVKTKAATNTVDEGTALPVVASGQPATEVLVPVQGAVWDDRGAMIAARYAARWNLPLRIVHVVTSDDEMVDANLRWAEVNYAVRPAVDVTTAGDSDAEVIAAIAAAITPTSLVVLSSDHAHQWVSEASVSEALVQALPGPLVMCGPHAVPSEAAGSVIVGLDGSPTAEAAIEPAVVLARSLDATLWLVKVVDAATSIEVARLRDQGHRVSESGYVREKADQLKAGGVDVGWEIVHSEETAPALASFAAERGAAMIVASSHGETGVARRVFGSVSLGLVEHSTMPVVIVRSSHRSEALAEG
jgi:nucleotide-binding universal stress UspA family protein